MFYARQCMQVITFNPSMQQTKKTSQKGHMIATSNMVLDFFLMSKLFNEIV